MSYEFAHDTLNAMGCKGDTNTPKGCLGGTLVSMAKEGPKMTAVAECEPRKLDDILVILREEAKKEYPDVANKIDDILSADNIPCNTRYVLSSQVLNNWQGMPSPLQYVKSELDSWVEGQVRMTRSAEHEELSRNLKEWKHRLDVAQYNRYLYKRDGAEEHKLFKIDADIKKHQDLISRAEVRLRELEDLISLKI